MRSILSEPTPAETTPDEESFDRGETSSARRQEKRVAYLVNVYPKVSHSFIRTEITALERMGLSVRRFTVRRSPDPISSETEDVEGRLTFPLLEGNWRGLLGATARSFLKRPGASAKALLQALRGNDPVRACAYFAEAAMLAEQLTLQGVRHVHVHFGTNPVTVARLAAMLAPITYSFTAHGPDEFDAPLGLDLPGKIADAAFVVGVSDFGRGQLMRWSDPADWSRIHTVRCAVAPGFLQPHAGDEDGLASLRLICVARLSPQKGLPLLIEAAARAARKRGFRIEIIGDGEGRPAIESQITRLGLQTHVRLSGWCTQEVVHQQLRQARALVLPSFAEGLPVVLMEALALGRPVVATSIAGIPELVDHENGWLIRSGSVEALADALHAVLDATPEQLRQKGEVGRSRVRMAHDSDRNAQQLAQLLQPFL